MKLAAFCTMLLVLLTYGCAAPVGQTTLSLHQRAAFPDGTGYELSEFKVSEQDTDRPVGARKVPGSEVTVGVDITNSGKPIRAADVMMQFFYAGDRQLEVAPREIASSKNSVPSGGRALITKTFRVEDISVVFRSRHIRVVIDVPDYPSVTFSGKNP